jgi:hypothetical protein
MSTQLHPAITPTEPTAAPAAPAAPAPAGLLTRLGGVCLAAGPVLFTLGAATSPHTDGNTREDFVASLADHPTQAALSANLLHYSWFGFVFGLLALTQLVRGARRGRALTCVPAVLGALGAIQISGLLMGDFFVSAIARHTSVATAVEVQDDLGTSVLVWLLSAQVLATLPVLVAFIGLARAGVLRWWLLLPLLLVPVAMVLPLPAAATVVLGLAAWTPAFAAARLLVVGRPAAA